MCLNLKLTSNPSINEGIYNRHVEYAKSRLSELGVKQLRSVAVKENLEPIPAVTGYSYNFRPCDCTVADLFTPNFTPTEAFVFLAPTPSNDAIYIYQVNYNFK